MKCIDCNDEISRNDQHHERWRLWRRGFTRRQAREIMPLCHRCMDTYLFLNWRDYGNYRGGGIVD